MKKSLATALSLVLVFALVLTGCQQSDSDNDNTADGAQAVATLDDYTVSLDEYSFFYRIYQVNVTTQAMYSGYGEEDMLEYWNTAMQDDILMKDMLAMEALQSAKEYVVLYNAALENGTQVPQETIDESDAQVDALVENYGGEEAFSEMFYMSSDLMKTMYNRMDLVDQYLLDLSQEVEVTDEEIESLYDQDRNKYSSVTVRHILISPDAEEEDEEKAWADALVLAEDVLSQVESGGDIGALAAVYSTDPGSKDNNGEYTFGRGQMVQPFEEWAFNAQPGDQGIVETSYGYHVMELIGHSDLDSIKSEVRDDIVYEKTNQLRDEMLQVAYSDDWTLNEALLSTLNVEQDLLDNAADTAEESPAEEGEEADEEE